MKNNKMKGRKYGKIIIRLGLINKLPRLKEERFKLRRIKNKLKSNRKQILLTKPL